MLTTTVSGGWRGGLGTTDMVPQCTDRSCSGKDQYSIAMFHALQAQLNRYAVAGATSPQSTAAGKDLWRRLIVEVDGKIGARTVNLYRLVADGLTQGGVPPMVPSAAASKETLAQNADTLARFLGHFADRAGLPPASVSIPGAPSGAGAAGFGPTTSPSTSTLTPDQAKRFLAIAAGSALSPNSLPGFDEGGVSADELVSQRLGPDGKPIATPWYKNPLVIVGGVLGVGAAAFFVLRRR